MLVGSTGADRSARPRKPSSRGSSTAGAPARLQRRSVLAAWTPLGASAGWSVLVAVPAELAYASVIGLRHAALTACALVALGVLALSFVVARRTSAGLARFDAAARALGAGDAGSPAAGRGTRRDRRGARATFNAMADELSRRAREARALERGPAARGRRAARASCARPRRSCVEAQKLAGIGQLGAGVAHEINNPLTGDPRERAAPARGDAARPSGARVAREDRGARAALPRHHPEAAPLQPAARRARLPRAGRESGRDGRRSRSWRDTSAPRGSRSTSRSPSPRRACAETPATSRR